MHGSLKPILDRQMEEIKEAGTYKAERIIRTPQSATIQVEGRDNSVLNFCANNYLGLSSHPDVIAAAHEALDTHGFGLSSVRFICGTQDIHKELEQKLATFHQTDDAILYTSCFDANGGLFETILTKEDAIISDSLNHASIIDGVRLCKAQRFRYRNADMADLEEKLKESQSARVRLIATDGVFSMDGTIAPLKEICDLADRYNAMVMVDDSHSTGFVGATGRGTPEYCDVMSRIDILTSTLGKALGGASGGYTTGRQEIIDMLRQKSRPYLFSNTLAPMIVKAAIKVLDVLSASTALRDRLEENTMHFRKRLTEAGFNIKAGDHPIVPIMLGDARLATEFADEMLERGIYVIGFSFPVVPRGEARIRVQLSAGHSMEQIDRAVDAFIEVGRSKGVIQ